MAKKTRKPNLPQETLARARRELEKSGDIAPTIQPLERDSDAAPETTKKPKAQSRRVSSVDLRQEYAYVIADLRQMAMLAAGIMVVLLILSFFI